MPDSCSAPGELERVHGRIDLVERTMRDLEASLEQRLTRLETQMTASNAHLDNISRASDQTNLLLESLTTQFTRQQDRADRQEELEYERTQSRHRLLTGAAAEVWDVGRGPLGYLPAAAATYLAFQYLETHDRAPNEVASPVSVERLTE